MSRAYRVKAPSSSGGVSSEAEGIMPNSLASIAIWSIATGTGIGVGWYLAASRENALYMGIPVAVTQALVLYRKWKLATAWAATTSVGWIVACVPMFLFGLNMNAILIGRGWTTAGDPVIGKAILLLTFVGVPITTIAQCLVLKWLGSEDTLRWFGVSAFGFMLVAFVGRVLTDAWPSATWVRGLLEIDPFEPRLWVIGAIWGAGLGWAMAKMPELMLTSAKDR